MVGDFFSDENTSQVLHKLFKEPENLTHPWLYYRGFIGSEWERNKQLLEHIRDTIQDMAKNEPSGFEVSYGQLLQKFYLENKSIEDISLDITRDSKTAYAYLKKARIYLAKHLENVEPPFWQNVPPHHYQSIAFETLLDKDITKLTKYLTESNRAGITGRPNSRRSALAAAVVRRVSKDHLVEACLWVEATTLNEVENQVEQLIAKYASSNDRFAHLTTNLTPHFFSGFRFLVVFDNLGDEIVNNEFRDYLDGLPNNWLILLVTNPTRALLTEKHVYTRLLSRDETRKFIQLYGAEKGLTNQDVPDELIDSIFAHTRGQIGEIDSIIERATRNPSENSLREAIEEARQFAEPGIGEISRIREIPGFSIMEILDLYQEPVSLSMLNIIINLPLTEIEQQLNQLVDFKVVLERKGKYLLRDAWRTIVGEIRKDLPDYHYQVLRAQEYFLQISYGEQGFDNVHEGNNLLAHFQYLHKLNLPKDAVQLGICHSEWFFDWLFENHVERLEDFVDNLIRSSETTGQEIASIIFESFRIHMLLRENKISKEVYGAIEKIDDKLADFVNVPEDIAPKLARVRLQNKQNLAYYLRNIGDYGESARLLAEVLVDSRDFHDEFFDDVTSQMLATVLYSTKDPEQILKGAEILKKQILWAKKVNHPRRLAGGYGRLAEAYIFFADTQEGEEEKTRLRLAAEALEIAIPIDQTNGRRLFVAKNSRTLAHVYNRIYGFANTKPRGSPEMQQKALRLLETAIPVLRKHDRLKIEDVELFELLKHRVIKTNK